jgi:hypothetical protein
MGRRGSISMTHLTTPGRTDVLGPMWISDWNKHCNSMDYKRLKDLYDVKIINLNN